MASNKIKSSRSSIVCPPRSFVLELFQKLKKLLCGGTMEECRHKNVFRQFLVSGHRLKENETMQGIIVSEMLPALAMSYRAGPFDWHDPPKDVEETSAVTRGGVQEIW